MLGIDVGTSFFCFAVWKNNEVKIVPDADDNRRIPSCIAFTGSKYLVGERAQKQMESNLKNTIYDIKQLIGRDYRDPKFQAEMKNCPFGITYFLDKSKIVVQHCGVKKVFFPEELMSLIFIEMLERAEDFARKKIKKAVISVPVCFNDIQRRAIVTAAKIAGLEVLRLINAPTAAALAYGFEKRPRHERIVLIYDIGGGTTDVSIVKIKDGLSFEVKSTAGNIYLGGEDFDSRLVSHFCNEFEKKFDINLDSYPGALRRLRAEAVRVKHTLSTSTTATVFVECLVDRNDYKIDYHAEITREQFNNLCAKLFERAFATIKDALADAKIDKTLIDDVVLVGGSTRIPRIQSMVQDFFHDKPLELRNKSEELTVHGAVIQAELFVNIPSQSNRIRSISFIDIMPYSIGLLIYPEEYLTVIERTAKVGYAYTKKFTTTRDNQEALEFSIYSGDNKTIHENNFFSKYRLTGIRPSPAGVPCIQVSFEITVSGSFLITARDYETKSGYCVKLIEGVGDHYFGRKTLRSIALNIEDVICQNEIKIESKPQKSSKHEEEEEEEELYEFNQEDKNRIIRKFDETAKWLENRKVIEKQVYINKFIELENMCTSMMEKKYEESGAAKKNLKNYILLIKQTIDDDCCSLTKEKKNHVSQLIKITEEWINANELVNKKENFSCMLDVTKTLIAPTVTKAHIEKFSEKKKLVLWIDSLKVVVEKCRYRNKNRKIIGIIRRADRWLKISGQDADKKIFKDKLREFDAEYQLVIKSPSEDALVPIDLLMVNKEIPKKRKLNDVNTDLPAIYVESIVKTESMPTKRRKHNDEEKFVTQNWSSVFDNSPRNVAVKVEKQDDELPEEGEILEGVWENESLMNEIKNVSVKIEEDEKMGNSFIQDELSERVDNISMD